MCNWVCLEEIMCTQVSVRLFFSFNSQKQEYLLYFVVNNVNVKYICIPLVFTMKVPHYFCREPLGEDGVCLSRRGSRWPGQGVRRWGGVYQAFQSVGWRYQMFKSEIFWVVWRSWRCKGVIIIPHILFLISSPSIVWLVPWHGDRDLPILPFPNQPCPPVPSGGHCSPDPTLHAAISQTETTPTSWARYQPWTGTV